MVSHDLRNPFSVATGYVDVARDEGDGDALDRAAEALDRMDTLVEDILTLARQDEAITERETVDLEALATDAWTTTESGDAAPAVRDGARLSVDRSRCQQLLENLRDVDGSAE